MRKTGLVYDDKFLNHLTGSFHPESPRRLEAIIRNLKETSLWEKLIHISPQPADLKWIEEIHAGDYIEFVKESCENGVSHLDADTAICPDSYTIALLAAGAGIVAADKIMSGEIENCFCAVRPPGHHAEFSHGMGFCLFNNIAILARYLQKQHQISKVLIVDWDVHHGNGTQNAFYSDPSVFYFSIHQWPHYPGSGASNEIGAGPGAGFTLNVPMRAGAMDQDYIDAFNQKLVPAMNEFKPEFILISAGFDGHKDDPLASMSLTEQGFVSMTDILLDLADYHCSGRAISLLEGGYNLETLPLCVNAHLSELLKGGAEK